jgi:2-oxoglutarate ferredoxin oxidoreductase subunit delta
MSFTQTINFAWCKKCGLCARYCPKKVFTLDSFGVPSVTNPEACVGCMQCEHRCPDFAISIMGGSAKRK